MKRTIAVFGTLMWYIFPQLKQLGYSSTSKFYGIENLTEACAYLADDLLRSRLVEISEALLALDSDDATQVMGEMDDFKLRSSMTLFLLAAKEGGEQYAKEAEVFNAVLEKFFERKLDKRTLAICGKKLN